MTKLAGEWHNQHGSRVVLEVAEDGRITGEFTSAIGLSRGRGGFRVTGFAAGDVLSFVVDFARYETVTSFTGHYSVERDQPVIRAMWHMAVAPPREEAPAKLWRGTCTGEDVFRRQPAEEASTSRRMPSHPVPVLEPDEW